MEDIEKGDMEENDFKNLKFVRPYKQLMIWAVLLNRWGVYKLQFVYVNVKFVRPYKQLMIWAVLLNRWGVYKL